MLEAREQSPGMDWIRRSPALTEKVAASIRADLARPASGDGAAAERVARRAINAVLSALEAQEGHPDAAPSIDLRAATAQNLVRGDPADHLAAQAHVRLAPAYVVLLLDRDRRAKRDPRAEIRAVQSCLDLEHRRDLLATPAEQHRVLVLLPAQVGVQRSTVRAIAERAQRGLVEAGRDPVLAVAPARSRDEIGAAADEARAVMHVVLALAYPPGVYQLDDVPIETSLMRAPDLAGMLALRLVPLYGSGAPLLDTLRVYLESSQDRRQAARALHVHPNTLDYRLRRIRELTGLSPNVPRDIQTLGAAITAWRLAGLADQHM